MIEGLNLDNLSVDANGRVSFSGLGSGIDLRGTVDAIIAARRIPIDTLESRVDRNLTKINALETLQVGLETLRSSLSRLYGQVSFGNSNDIFSMKQAFASSFRIDGTAGSAAGNLMGVTVNNSASTGSHTIEVLQTAKTQKISSDAIASTTAGLGFSNGDQFTITSDQTRTSFNTNVQASGAVLLGSAGTLEFTDETGNSLGSVSYLATDTLNDLATAITDDITGVSVSVATVSGGVRLELTSATEFQMSETAAGSALTDFELGVRRINVNLATNLLDLRDAINAANSGANATGVNASIVTVSASESYLVLTAEETGVTMSLAETNGTPLQDVGILTAGSAVKNQLQAAQDALLYADGLLDQSNKTYETSLQSAATTQVGSTGQLTFTRDSDSGTISTLNYSSSDDLTAIAAAINGDVSLTAEGIAAEVVSDGAGVRLEIIGTAGFTISESGAGTAIDDLGIDNKRRVIERSSNTIDDLFAGVTLSLFAAEKGTTVSLDIEQDLSQVKSEIFTFVEAYNSVRQFINENRLVDEATVGTDEETGILFDSTALDQVSDALGLIVGQGTPGVDRRFSVLSQIGVDFIDFGETDPLLVENLQIDEAKLDEVLLANAADVQKMFSFSFTSSDSRVSLLGFNGNTSYAETGYTLNLQPETGSNQVLYSEQADDAYYTKTGLTVSADAIAAPGGAVTADGLIATAAAGPHTLGGSFINVTAGQSYVVSAYVKAGAVDQVRLGFSGSGMPGNARADFNLATGAIVQQGTASDAATIEDVGDGFYRVSITVTADATGTASLEVTPKDTSSGVGFSGDGSSVSTYVWGMQVDDATENTTEISSFAFTRSSLGTDIATAPDGSATADGIIADTNALPHIVSNNATVTVEADEAYSFTVYAKADARDKLRLNFGSGNFGADTRAEFDLTAGTTTYTGADLDSVEIVDATNGWYRVTISGTAATAGTEVFEIYPMDAAGISFAGDGVTVDTQIWNPHIVKTSAAVPGSYVTTTSAAVSGVLPSANIDGAPGGLDDSSATINGNILTVNSGGAEGLQLFFDGFSGLATSVQLDFTIGIAAQMFFKIEELLDKTTGILPGEIDQLTDQNTLHDDRIEEMLTRLEIQRANLLQRYINMETAVSTANNIMKSLRATIDGLSGSNS